MRRYIYYYDTDAEGVVYYANYLRFFEEARTKLIEDAGFNLKALAEEGYLFAIRRQEVDYKAPLWYGENIEIKTKIKEITPYRIIFYYEIYNSSGKRTTTAITDMVCISKNFHLREIPQNLKQALEKFIEQ